MKRYMGSKRAILDALFAHVRREAPGARTLLDPFSGAGSVVQRASRLGMRTFSSDLNAASRELAMAYTQARVDERFEGVLDAPAKDTLTNLRSALALLDGEGRKAEGDGVVYRWWCPEGDRSAFTTARGRSDHRNYFTPENAARIDAALDGIRAWWRAGRLTRVELALLNAALLSSAERVANIKGTYGMPARGWQAGVERPLTLDADDELAGSAGPIGVVGDRVDALTFAREHGGKDILYLDPPYNFRIYLDYYHIPNFLAQHALLDDPLAYAERFRYARGQNMEDRPAGKEGARFNDPARFHEALRAVIEAAACKTVVLSYFDGVNHHNDFDAPDNGESWTRMLALFRGLGAYAKPKVYEIPRQNMQSQKGRAQATVNEYVLVARMAQPR